MFTLGIFAEFFVRVQLINWDDATLTLSNITQSQRLFESGIFAFILIVFLDVVIAITFYVLFHTINKPIAKIITWLVLVAGIGYAVNSLVSFFAVEYTMLRNVTIGIFIIPMTFAELTLGLWLWIKQKNLPLSLNK